MEQKRKKSGARILWAVCLITGVLLAFSMLLNVVLGVGFIFSHASEPQTDHPVDEKPRFKEIWSQGSGRTKAVHIDITGVISRDMESSFWGTQFDRVESILRQIRAARNDSSVQAILLDINSPGGAITPTDEIYSALKAFRTSQSNRVVVACCSDLMASGGYYIGLAADRIIAQPTSVIGSIGVLIQTLNWAELSERIGVRDTTVKSGDNKDLFNPFRPVTEDERAIMQSLVDGFHGRFIRLVADARDLTVDEVTEIADGQVMTAGNALELGLIDRIGYWDEAIDEMRKITDRETLKIIRYEENERFFLRLARVIAPLRFSELIHRSAPSVEYRWKP